MGVVVASSPLEIFSGVAELLQGERSFPVEVGFVRSFAVVLQETTYGSQDSRNTNTLF